MSSTARNWKIEARSQGRHVHVVLRAGPKPQDRARHFVEGLHAISAKFDEQVRENGLRP